MRRLGGALRSLRWRLTLTFVGLLAILLAGLGTYQYITLRQSLIASRVAGLSDDLVAGKALFRDATADAVPPRATAFRLLATSIKTASGQSVAVIVFDRAGVKRAQTPASTVLPQLDATRIAAIAASGRTDTEVLDAGNGAQLVAGFQVDQSNRGVAAVAQLSMPMTPIDTVLDHELVLILAGSLVALLLALGIGLLLTGGALRPLRRLTVTAGELAAGDLRARSRLVPRPDEVGVLTSAFDHMADRIEEAFTAQQESEARTRRFIADASHELRTPVTALKGYIDVIRRGAVRDPGALDAALEAMAREAERMRMLVLDLLTLARIDARGQQTAEDFDLTNALALILGEGVPGMPARLDRDFPASPVLVHCDRGALTTIARNLLINACKHAPGARQVWSIRVDSGRARIDAHDEGPGISSADLAHVFERFYRGEKTRSRDEGGSGLGLSIVEGLVRAQAGEVAITSAEGAGTTVTVWLPLAARELGVAA